MQHCTLAGTLPGTDQNLEMEKTTRVLPHVPSPLPRPHPGTEPLMTAGSRGLPYLLQRGVRNPEAHRVQTVKVLLQGLEEPFEAGPVRILGDAVDQLPAAAGFEERLRDVNLYQRRGSGDVLRVVSLQNRTLAQKRK